MSPPELARLVHEARPCPRQEWASALDARVAAGFPRDRRPRLSALARPTVLLPAAGTVACLIAAVLIALPALRGDGRDQSASTAKRAVDAASGAPAERGML